MLQFQSVTNTDYALLRPYIQSKRSRLCDATVGALWFWKDYYKTQYAIYDNLLFFSSQLTLHDRCFYFFPSQNPNRSLDLLEEYCRKESRPMILYPVEESCRPLIESRYGKRAVFTPLRDAFDYLYDAKAFVSFAGKAYHRQRNHISKFKKTYPNHRFSPLASEDFPALSAFYSRYLTLSSPADDTAKAEKESILRWLRDENPLGFLVGCLWVEDEIVGFSIAEIIGDTLHVHIEKADIRYAGVYQMLSNSFAALYCNDTVLYINRQDDLGDAGLRQSKLSYRPIALLEKNLVTISL